MNAPEAERDERIIWLQGGHNFRDLGGYATEDGRRTARRRVFRSGSLYKLSEEDQDVIRKLGIRAIYDLRSDRERAQQPSVLPADLPVEIWSRPHAGSTGNLLGKMIAPGGSAEKSRDTMIDSYRDLAYEQAESYRELFAYLAAGELPVLFHCAAGKDRTGVAAALLLEVLGVPRQAIIEDYVLTDVFFEQGMEMALSGLGSTVLQGVMPDIWAPLMRADRVYLETMFETLEARHGSLTGYLHDVLGLDDALQARLRERLCV